MQDMLKFASYVAECTKQGVEFFFQRCNTRRSPLEVPSSFCMVRHNGMLYTEKSQSFDKNHESLKEFKLQNLPLKAAGARLLIAEQPAPHP